ncbi:MAG TPA: hypothetical protein VIL00_06550 [Pseudonocardiaceae bacterium]
MSASSKSRGTVVGTAGAMRSVLRLAGLALAVGTPVALLAGWLVAGAAGLWGALLGVAVAAVFLLVTVVVMIVTSNSSPNVTAAALLGSWLLKVVLMMGALWVLRGMTFYHRTVFGVVAIVAMVVLLAAETRAVLAARTPYVEPASGVRVGGTERGEAG